MAEFLNVLPILTGDRQGRGRFQKALEFINWPADQEVIPNHYYQYWREKRMMPPWGESP